MTINMLTAAEALAQGSTPSTFFSIARFNERMGNNEVGQAARRVARELAQLLGMDLGGRRRAANNNRPRSDRRAA
ncbi:hypothetical protein LB533_20590 [Mesorhizobium sp. BR1-1-13]|uniref:hypothetical protein n=1 Tax=Mesorhizobium sp. BR1-1-13 TaxID=2876656 RepID=UPI001CD16CA1|nr:hypothetical protein [Mesorhizobium sp. BR1-1-13]MBZ9943488.1 hypothetical protein [Mesorhizobium sp. BR1-1-13]